MRKVFGHLFTIGFILVIIQMSYIGWNWFTKGLDWTPSIPTQVVFYLGIALIIVALTIPAIHLKKKVEVPQLNMSHLLDGILFEFYSQDVSSDFVDFIVPISEVMNKKNGEIYQIRVSIAKKPEYIRPDHVQVKYSIDGTRVTQTLPKKLE